MSSPPMPAPQEAALDRARLRLHHVAAPSAVLASALAGLVLAWLLDGPVPRPLVTLWLAALALALAARWWVRTRAGDDGDDEHVARWLRAHRAAYLLHGLVWGALAVASGPRLGGDALAVWAVILGAMAAGSVAGAAHDLRAGAAFVLPTLAPVLLRLVGAGGPAAPALATALAVFIAVMVIVAHRYEQVVRGMVAAQSAERARSDDAEAHARDAEAARAALADQHFVMQQLLYTTQQGYWFIDNDGRTADVNPAMCALLGRPREEIVGRGVREFFGAGGLAVLDRELERRRRGESSRYEIDIVRPDGSVAHCVNSATPLSGADGRPLGSIGLWTDITQQKRTALALRTHEWLVNAVTDPISVIDDTGRYLMVNDAWCAGTGIAREAALGRPVDEVLGGDRFAGEHAVAMRECIERHAPRRVAVDIPMRGRGRRRLETVYYPYRDDASGTVCIGAVSRDVTEQEESRLAIETAAEYLRQTLNATGDAIFASDATDPGTPVRFANEQMLALWDITLAPGEALTPARIMAAATPLFVDPQAEGQRVREVIAGNAPHTSRLQLRDGRVLLRRCVPATVAGGMVRVWSFRDITAEEQALQIVQQSEAAQRSLLEAFPGLIAAVDGGRRYTYVNAPMAQAIGLPAEAIVGRQVDEVEPPSLFRGAEPQIEAALAGGVVRQDLSQPAGRGAEGRIELEVSYVAGPARADGSRLCYAFGIDITARKEAKLALIVARDEAERANRAKSRFLAQMSHELRTPMNAIVGFGQLLEHDPKQPLARHQQGWVREILRGARHLLGLINELLDLGRIEAGQMSVEAAVVPLAELADDCLRMVQPLALGRQVTLHPSAVEPVAVRADPTRLKQVLLNLLGNAVKYNRVGGEVRLATRREDDAVVIEVHDTGPGLSREDQARLFQPFERLGAKHSGIEGSGIGLALSRRLVLAMGGRIGVDSAPGAGSCFWIALPEAVPASVADATPHDEAVPQDTPPARVLYVDDSPVNVTLMEAMLARLPGIELHCAALPAEGLRMAAELRPALVLLDIQMPEMDGYEVLARLRAHPGTAGVPVVAVSANALPGDIEVALTAGFSAYLTKPLSLDALFGTVRRLLAPAPGTSAR